MDAEGLTLDPGLHPREQERRERAKGVPLRKANCQWLMKRERRKPRGTSASPAAWLRETAVLSGPCPPLGLYRPCFTRGTESSCTPWQFHGGHVLEKYFFFSDFSQSIVWSIVWVRRHTQTSVGGVNSSYSSMGLVVDTMVDVVENRANEVLVSTKYFET